MSKHHLSQRPPYVDTRVPYGATKIAIEEMLKEWGAKALRWTETPDSMKGVDLPVLEFVFETEVQGVQKTFGVRIKPPLTSKRVMNGNHRVNVPNKNGSMRLLYWYLKARIEAARFGMEDEFQTFMSKIMHALPPEAGGGVSTLGETMEEHPEVFSGMLPTFEIRMPALEDKAR
jgi:hypothetical protein